MKVSFIAFLIFLLSTTAGIANINMEVDEGIENEHDETTTENEIGSEVEVDVDLELELETDAEVESEIQETPGMFMIEGIVTKEQRSAIASTGAVIEEIGEDYVVVFAMPDEVKQIEALSFNVEGLVMDLDFPSADSGYHNYTEMVEKINAAAQDHADIVEKFSIGQSYEGRELWAVKISDNPEVDEDEAEVLYVSMHHAREHLTVEMALYLLSLFTDNYGTDSKITELVNSREIIIVFSLNPDGAEYDVEDGSYSFWRKNRQPNSGSSNIGTDLNRNYGYNWGCCGGSSGSTGSDTYRGTSPFSAPETAALRDYINSRVVDGKQQITTAISFHTYSELILYPYGYTYTDVPGDMTQDDHNVFVALANEMASSNGYTPEQSSDLYIVDGDMTDWAYGEHNIFAFTFEMYPKGSNPGFYPPDEVIDRETERNREAIVYLTDIAACPYDAIGKGSQYCGDDGGGGDGEIIFQDDFESNSGWVVDPDGLDTASTGNWEIADPSATSYSGAKQLGTTTSGSQDLVTGASSGFSAGSNDIDGGATTVKSPAIPLPTDGALTLEFSYYFAHYSNASNADFFKVSIADENGNATVFERFGSATNIQATWLKQSIDVSSYAGKTIHIQFEAADGGSGSLVEAGVDDVIIKKAIPDTVNAVE